MDDDGADLVIALMREFVRVLADCRADENVRGTAVGLLVGRIALMTEDPEASFMAIGTVAGNVIAASPMRKRAAAGIN